MYFQDLILKLQAYWASRNCILAQGYDQEVGAGTMNPATFLRVLGPEPWNVAYVDLKPNPPDVQELYLGSLRAIGIDPLEHDIRFVEDDWESPTLGAWGLGWEVWCDGMEITQYTYFQQAGGFEVRPVAAELTYGLERIAMYLQDVENVFDVEWVKGVRYREVFHRNEVEMSEYSFRASDPKMLFNLFDIYEAECKRLLEAKLPLPAYDYCLKCSHAFNNLDARGAISVTERAAYIGRVRALAHECARGYLESREALGFPLLPPARRKAELEKARAAREARESAREAREKVTHG